MTFSNETKRIDFTLLWSLIVCSSLAKKSGFLEDLESAQKKDPNRHNINGDLEVSPMSNLYRPAADVTTQQ